LTKTLLAKNSAFKMEGKALPFAISTFRNTKRKQVLSC